jgi:HAE1 family hydrophobic/amphiphilic exporter-1
MDTDWQRAFTHILAGLILACGVTALASAQTPAPKQEPAPGPNLPAPAQPATPSQTTPSHLAGVEADKIVRWTLNDAIMAALEKNPDIEIARHNVRLSQFDVLAAQGAYDPITSSTLNYVSQKTPNVSRFSGSSQNFLQNDAFGYNLGYSKLVEKTGGSYQINFNNSRLTSNAASLATSYNPTLTAALTQPLLKNLGFDSNRHLIQIARKKLDLSDAQFRQQVIQIITDVQEAYWNLAFAIRSEEIQRDALKLAEKQLENNLEQLKVGTLAQLDVINAAAQVENVRQQVFQAMQTVAQAADALKTLTVEGPGDDLWTANIIPVESFELKPLKLPLPDALRLALANRPEVRQFALQKEMNELDVKFFRNQTKPQVDLTASYGLVGVAGSAASFPDQNGVLQPANVPSAFVGGYGVALRNLFDNSFPTWGVGVNVSLPLRNRTAQANLGGALETGRQLDAQLRKQLQTIEADVRAAYHAVESAELRCGAARAAREYAEKQLAGEQEKFSVGLSTTFLVLTRQNDLSQARGAEAQALTDYNKAIAALQSAISTTLTDNSVEIRSGKDEPVNDGKRH